MVKILDHDRDSYFEKYGDRLSKHGITLYVKCNEEGTEVYSLSARNSEGNLIEGMDNETVLVEMMVFNNSFEWAVEDNILKLYVTDDGKKQLAYEYEIEEESADNITLYELDEDGKRVEGATIKLSK